MPIRDEAINVFMGLPGDGDRLELTYNFGVDSYELGTGYNHIALTVDDLDGTLGRAGGEGHRPREAAVPRARGRLAALLRARPRRLPDRADASAADADVERRLAVIDLGSNSFRLVVFTHTDDWWKRTDEIYEPVRVGEHQETGGPLQPEPMERALETIELFAHFCRATGIERVRPLATSAIREASNREEFVRAARERSGLDVEVLSREEEARYGYLAAVNSTTLTDGVALDIGGGSMQLTQVADRRARGGAVVAARRGRDDRALPADGARQAQAPQGAARARARRAPLAPWLAGAHGRLAGIGGTVRNLAGDRDARGGPARRYGVQGFTLRRDALDALVERLAELTPAERRRVPGLKPERADLILAGAVVVQTVMEVGGFDALEVTEAGLREGVFFEELLAGAGRAAAARRARGVGAQPRRPVPPRGRAHRARREARAGDLGRARGRRRAPRPRRRARAAVGRGDPARHRHGRRLRRPPQALALPDPQRRPARLLAARDRADRPDGPLPPQGPARAARVRAARAARATRSCSPAAPRCCVSPSSSSARATRPSGTRGVAVQDGDGRAAAGEQGATSTSAAGAPSARPTSSAARVRDREPRRVDRLTASVPSSRASP